LSRHLSAKSLTSTSVFLLYYFAFLSAKQSTYGVTAFVNESLQFNGPASNIWAALSNARWPLSV